MTITLYTKPDFKGDTFEFDPQNVKYIYYTRPDENSPYKYQTTDNFIDNFPTFWRLEQRLNIASVRNETNDFFLVIISLTNNEDTTIQGTVNDTGLSDTYGYILVIKNTSNCNFDIQPYKNAMIVSICIFIAIILLFCLLFYTGFLKYQSKITFTEY